MAVAQSWGKIQSLHRALGCFIQSIAKPAHNTQHPDFSICREKHVDQNFPLHPILTSFGCVYGDWLTLDRNRN